MCLHGYVLHTVRCLHGYVLHTVRCLHGYVLAFVDGKKGACGNVDTSGGLLKFKGAFVDEKKTSAATCKPQEGF